MNERSDYISLLCPDSDGQDMSRMCEPSRNTPGRPYRTCDGEMLILEHEIITAVHEAYCHCMMLLSRLSLEESVVPLG